MKYIFFEASGTTNLHSPLLSAYKNLSGDAFKDHQKAVIIITDGRIKPDKILNHKLHAAKKDILTFVYFLGAKDDQHLIGLADAFLESSSDIKTGLDNYFHSLSSAYGMQKVLSVHKCKGGSYAKAN